MKRVLVVDDAAFMRFSLKKMLEKNGYQIVGEASNGTIAIKKYEELKPDIVTMDITMPEMNGLTALQKIRDIDPKSKIVMISAIGQQNMVLEAIKLGAQSFIVKPFQEEQILRVLSKF